MLGLYFARLKHETLLKMNTISKPAASVFTFPVIACLIGVYLIWGSTYLGISWAIRGIPPFLMAGTRFVIASMLIGTWCLYKKHPLPSKAQWKNACIMGLLMMVGGNGLVTVAEQWMPTGVAAVMIATVPLFALVFSHLHHRQKAHPLEWAGILTGFAGIVLLNSDHALMAKPLGILMLLAAAASWAWGSVWSKNQDLLKGMMGSAAQMLAGGVMMLVLGLLRGERLTSVPDQHALLALGYLVLFGSILGYTSFVYLMNHVRPALATSYAYVNPVVAVSLGVLLNNEQVTLKIMLAMGVILCSIFLVMLAQKRQQATDTH